MPDIIKTDQPPPDPGHEDRDINVRAIVRFSVVMAIGLGLTHLVIAWLFGLFDRETTAAYPELPALARKERPRLPQNLESIPEPRLQPNETADLATLRKREDAILTSYGVDKDKNIRIPIARAMEILADPKQAARHGVLSRPEGKP